jgi:hypothetical protein
MPAPASRAFFRAEVGFLLGTGVGLGFASRLLGFMRLAAGMLININLISSLISLPLSDPASTHKVISPKIENKLVVGVFKKKEEPKPAIEIGLNVGGLLESMGLESIVDRVLDLIQKGKLEVRIELGTKKGKIPASVVVKLRKAEA